MTDDNIKAKALALVNEVRAERGWTPLPSLYRTDSDVEALCRAIERHETYKQEVGFALSNEWHNLHYGAKRNLDRFRIPLPKPDPLVDAIESVLSGFESRKHAESYAHHIRAKLDNSGFEIEIREKSND